jgi:hypothetical protein
MDRWLILHPVQVADGLRSGVLRALTDEEKARKTDAVAWCEQLRALVFESLPTRYSPIRRRALRAGKLGVARG